ncbi:MAG TPA: hypothetical protein VFO70_01960 [Chitinophagaceae bacterium]|nr:hypothetical protein [Chitinophagaceae bacterium]HEX5653031.1 hypothetical protein [Chitinophagaceae bacterium]
MNKILSLVIALGFLSCNNEASKEDVTEDTIIEEAFLSPQDKLLWISDFDTMTGDFVLKHQRQLPAEEIGVQSLIDDINAAWENIRLEFRKLSGDTIYVAIPDSKYLTQQMGSAGAGGYIASVTFNLTELKNIRFVNYDFEEGDHLAPGTFSREDFKNYR